MARKIITYVSLLFEGRKILVFIKAISLAPPLLTTYLFHIEAMFIGVAQSPLGGQGDPYGLPALRLSPTLDIYPFYK